MGEVGFVDVEPIKLVPTWKNNRVGEVGVSKTLGKFLVTKVLMVELDRVRPWVELEVT